MLVYELLLVKCQTAECLLLVVRSVVGEGGVVHTPGVEPLELSVGVVVHGSSIALVLGPVDISGLGGKSEDDDDVGINIRIFLILTCQCRRQRR